MKARNLALALSALALATASFAANADILFQNLGTSAPPTTLGSHVVTPFDQTPQALIADGTDLNSIPGGPNGETLGISPLAKKRNVPTTWGTWSHGYVGAVYRVTGNQIALTLPVNTGAFYFYAEPDSGTLNLTATTDTGVTSPSLAVGSSAAANGFAFYATAGESIASVTITASGDFFAVGEFGIRVVPPTTCASEGYTGTKLTWCKNICENGLTGQTLDTWIHRWINRYRDLPYCAQEGGGGNLPPET